MPVCTPQVAYLFVLPVYSAEILFFLRQGVVYSVDQMTAFADCYSDTADVGSVGQPSAARHRV